MSDTKNSDRYRPLLEELAALEHRQWVYWTENLAAREDLPDHLIERWERNWVDYDELTDDEKDPDRKWAKEVLHILNRGGRKPTHGHLVRTEDESGVSGTGIVAEFTEFSDGRVVISWWNDANENLDTEGNGLAIYDSMDDAEQVHGHGGRTEFRYLGTDRSQNDSKDG